MTTAVKATTRKKLVRVEIEKIHTSFYVRLSLDPGRIEQFKDFIEAGTDLGPIILDEDMELIDGRHRIEAHILAGYKSIDAEIRHYETQVGAMAAAMAANLGGALPPTYKDMRHAVQGMIKAGAKLTQLRQLLPQIPYSMVKRLANDAWSAIRKENLAKAVSLISDKGYTVAQAAAEIKINADDLKALLTRRKRDEKTELGRDKGALSHSWQSMARQYKKMFTRKVEALEDGEIDKENIQEFLSHGMSLARRHVRVITDMVNRLEAITKGRESSDLVSLEDIMDETEEDNLKF